MAGGNSTGDSDYCSPDALDRLRSLFRCSDKSVAAFRKSMRGQLWRVNAMLFTDAVLAGVIVAIGAYGQRYRHHPFTRFVFLGATTLFLPILSYVVSSTDSKSNNYSTVNEYSGGLVADCEADFHTVATVTWAFLVQIVVINTSTVVAADDREGRNVPPPYELFIQGVWTFYLGASIFAQKPVDFLNLSTWWPLFFEFFPFVLICVKIMFKLYAYGNAQRSFALGRNPHLVSGYSQQLQVEEGSPHGEPPVGDGQDVQLPPPLMVKGEEMIQVEKQPQGYVLKDVNNRGGLLVTLDRVWQLDDMLLAVPRPLLLKDLCLSFALFKLLRCRFARYKLGDAGSKGMTTDFIWGLLMKDGEHVRIFRLIADEVSFVHDYYYSSIPICYAKRCLLIWSLCISLLSIGYCIVVEFWLLFGLEIWKDLEDVVRSTQMLCSYRCWGDYVISHKEFERFGRTFFDLVLLFLLVTLVMISEIRDIGSYICSNWTKVGLVCWYVNHTSWQHFVPVQKWVALLLRCRCKLMKHWNEEMGQCSVLVLQPRTLTPLALLRRVLRLPDKERSVRVSAAVKACIIDALRSHRSTGACMRPSRVHENFPAGTCNSRGTSGAILTWHIATCILESRYPCQHDQEQGSPPAVSDDRITAVHLSRYCTYLVAWYPELLPDDVAWSKSVYKAVKKDAGRALAARRAAPGTPTPAAEYEQLLKLLGENSRHEVLRNGARLAMELVEFSAAGEGEEAAWKLLAGFWSEMILYAAPSKNLKGHSEAIARGGELITLLWALLFHAGIVSRSATAPMAADTV